MNYYRYWNLISNLNENKQRILKLWKKKMKNILGFVVWLLCDATCTVLIWHCVIRHVKCGSY